ncbi:MAG: S9 family peptidase, partial [Bacteroidota bacterium]
MKKLFTAACVGLLLTNCATEQATAPEATTSNPMISVQYPTTTTVEQQDDYFGTTVSDPYRWLEDDRSEETAEWVKAQNTATFGYLEQIPYRDAIAKRYTELFNYPKLSSPFKAGDYYFFYKNDGLQNQSVIFFQKGLDGTPDVFIDPNAIDANGTTAINIVGFSEDNRYAAYTQSVAGSDWTKIKVMEVATKETLEDELEWVKFSGASWYKDGFFYSRYPAPAEGKELSGDNKNHSVYYHQLGQPQSEDKLIYADPAHPDYYHFGGVTEDNKYLILYAQPGTDGFATYYKDMEADGEITPLFEGYDKKSSVVHHLGDGKMLVRTNIDAPNYRLVEVDVNRPGKENWKEIIPHSDNLLQGVSTGGGKLFASYLEKATTRVYRYDYDGGNKQDIALPGLGSAYGFGGKEEDTTLFYTFTSFTYPPTIFKYDVTTDSSEEFYKTALKFNPA